MTPKIVFLHIPKTAGQSVRRTLGRTFGQDALAPVQVNAHFEKHPPESLMDYQIFTGHLDWERLDFVPSPKVVFTILREPLERIASFYLFIRGQAEKHSDEELAMPHLRGQWMAKNLSIDEYFCDTGVKGRNFIDGLYDNFYTHFLAGRRYGARNALRAQYGADASGDDAILKLAQANAAQLDLVGRVEDMADFSDRLGVLLGQHIDFMKRRVNVNTTIDPAASRFQALLDLKPSDATVARLHEFARLDSELYRSLCL
jgi:hypothetical protein